MNTVALLVLFASVTKTFGLPDGLLSSICYTESHYDTKAINTDDGRGNSVGVCQVKLSTSRTLGFKGSERQLQDPSVNIYYSGKYLRRQLNRYGGDSNKAIAAYNSGTLKLNENGDIRNQNYVDKVVTAWKEGQHRRVHDEGTRVGGLSQGRQHKR